jgi:P27 family predicted phage terminase small subunit
MVGRKPKPAKIHELNGFPGKRKLNRREPKPRLCIPLPPAHLSEQIKEAWRKLAVKLHRMGVLTEADAWGLEELSETYVEVRDLRQQIAQEGRTVEITTTTGDVREVTNPLVNQLSDAAKRLRALMVEFGLTPSARTRVNVTEEKEEDPLDRFFR